MHSRRCQPQFNCDSRFRPPNEPRHEYLYMFTGGAGRGQADVLFEFRDGQPDNGIVVSRAIKNVALNVF